MLSRKNNVVQAETPSTVISKGISLEAARMTGQESVRIDGNYKGDIDIEGTLVLGDTSSVTGNVHAKYIVAAGKVDGNLKCDTVLHLATTARIAGNVEAQSLIVDEGSQINGKYKIGDLAASETSSDDKTNLRRVTGWPGTQADRLIEKVNREPEQAVQ